MTESLPHWPEWFERMEAQADWMGSDDLAFQIDHCDLVHVCDIDTETGEARITVFASTHPEAEAIFTGTVNVKER